MPASRDQDPDTDSTPGVHPRRAAAPADEDRASEPLGPATILEKKARYLIPWVKHFYADPPQIVRGQGTRVEDHAGRSYLDVSAGVAVLNLGHSHPEIAAAARRGAETLQHTTTIYLTQPIVDLAEALAAVTPGDLSCSFFTTSGSEANEAALLLASHVTGRHEFIALDGALHGRTKLTLSVTGLAMWRSDRSPVGGVSFAPAPYCYRCPFGKTYPSCDLACARAVENVIETSTSREPAALIAEPIQGNGGIIDPPDGYFAAVREILDRHGALLIVDEAQTGIGRTGKFFGIEHHDVVPDILTTAKALGNGYPIGAAITTPELAALSTRPGASTLGGSPFTASIALTALRIHVRDRIAERAAAVGAHLRGRLDELRERFPRIGDVRGRGLMLGAEMVDEAGAPDAAATDRILEALKERGVLLGKSGRGRNVLTFQPPLTITLDEIDEIVETLESVLLDCEEGR